jgi:hypothetical protein
MRLMLARDPRRKTVHGSMLSVASMSSPEQRVVAVSFAYGPAQNDEAAVDEISMKVA